MTLPPAFNGLRAFNQWLNFRLTPQDDGKLKKEAVGRSGWRVDPTDPAEWMSYEQAAATGLPLAFSFTADDPFFFLDIDHALQDDGTWNALAAEMCATFAGCAVEVSSSGRGLHIFGIGATTLPRRIQDDALGLALYTELRFAALTGTNCSGDVMRPAPPGALDALVTKYLPPTVYASGDFDWTSEPVPEWSGPTDDADLVRRASLVVNASHAFGGKASFADLWEGDVEKLSAAFPPEGGGAFNGSSADAALCAHLAFWTGKDCERMARLLRASGLARDKHAREDYMQRTVLNACRLSSSVHQDKPLQAPRAEAPAASAEVTRAEEAKPSLIDGSVFVRPEQACDLFAGCVYVRDIHRVWMPNGELLKPDGFRAWFGGYVFIMDDVGKKTTDDAFKAFTNNPTIRCPQVASTAFDPKLPPGAIVTDFKGRKAVNTWLPPKVRVVTDGDVSPFTRHVEKLLPVQRDRDILLSWMAALVQFPGHKFTWAPVLQGVEGNGKSFFALCCAKAVSPLYSHTPRNKDLIKDFNSWMNRKLFAVVDEARVDTPDMIEAMRNLITEETQTVEPKGVDADSTKVFVNFMFTMNDKKAMRKTRNDRRLAVFYTAQQQEADIARDGLDGDYMQDLYDWAKGLHRWKPFGEDYGFAVITDYLQTYPIPDELNPIGAAHRAPKTSTHEEAVAGSLGVREQELLEAIDSYRPGFRDGWVSSHYALELLQSSDRRVRVGALDEILQALGYVRHPSLRDGRVNNAVMPDGARSVLFVSKKRMDLLALPDSGSVSSAYTKSQLESA